MSHNLKTESVPKLLLELSIPAILGMLSSAIFNLVDRIFVGQISSYALTAVGITMPIQILQMAFILLIGIGSSALISVKLGEQKKEDAEDILYLALKYILIFLVAFAALFVLFVDPILELLAISEQVYPYAKSYILVIIVGSIIGIPGYCLNNSLRSIGQAKTSMMIIGATSVLNIILDPIFIFGFDLGIIGAAIATVISQTTLTVYVIYAFMKRSDFLIHLKRRHVVKEKELLFSFLNMGMPSFYVQLLATVVNFFLNHYMLRVGTDLDIAAVTIMSSVFSFYHMVVFGIVQGNNVICGYNFGAKEYGRVKKSLELSLVAAFALSSFLYALIFFFPNLIVGMFTQDTTLAALTTSGMKIYLCMLPLIGLQTISSQYYQAIGRANTSSMLSFLRYGVIVVPAVLLLSPQFGVTGIYVSNALSDGIASIVAIGFIVVEIRRLNRL